MNCSKCGLPIDEKPHSFAGYGYYIEYHKECCPKELDGSECGLDHEIDQLVTLLYEPLQRFNNN
jgi:hypothetical protein